MNSESTNDQPDTFNDIAEKGREALAAAQFQAADTVDSAASYIRANPWIAVAGALLVGGAIGAACRSGCSPRKDKMDAVRGWLDEAYAKLPNQKQVQSAADSIGISDFLKHLSKKLHIS